jgi:hypothetical protein
VNHKTMLMVACFESGFTGFLGLKLMSSFWIG